MTAAHIICVKAPVKIESLLNKREHWRAGLRRKAAHRKAAQRALGPDIKGPPPPYTITLTRIGPGTLDDDNLAASFKNFRDGVADWLGIDDGDKRLTWRYEQRKGAPKEYAAEIVIESAVRLARVAQESA